MTCRIAILNGPNLNLLGTREPHIYGLTTLAEIEIMCRSRAEALGAALTFRQSNHEGVLVDWIQEVREDADVLIINPAAYSFRSVALIDAMKALGKPIIELHVSNIHARDELHRHSITSTAATAVICGLGPYGYVAAIEAAVHLAGGRR
ncbi:type II 3-dehydroquinate dehydratase [Phreatobacter sp.]|uniref:type II 3-dehydroquinate dehydratase n=1 Tax=Phreatobacter sp. TaxID=1966341 RepID=UPI003F70B983